MLVDILINVSVFQWQMAFSYKYSLIQDIFRIFIIAQISVYDVSHLWKKYFVVINKLIKKNK